MPGAVLPAVIAGGRTVAGPEFDPLWAAAQELDVPVSTHGGTTATLGLDGIGGNFTVGHLLEHPFAQFRQFGAMMFEGVFERFPRLRYGCLECGIGWLPWFLDRMDEELERKGQYSPQCKRKPSEYMQDMYYTSQPLERSNMKLTQATFEAMHAETQLLYASDWPHWDFDAPGSITKLPFLKEDAKRNMDLVAQVGGKRIAAPPAGAIHQPDLDLLRAAERYRALLELGDRMGVVPQVEVWRFSR